MRCDYIQAGVPPHPSPSVTPSPQGEGRDTRRAGVVAPYGAATKTSRSSRPTVQHENEQDIPPYGAAQKRAGRRALRRSTKTSRTSRPTAQHKNEQDIAPCGTLTKHALKFKTIASFKSDSQESQSWRSETPGGFFVAALLLNDARFFFHNSGAGHIGPSLSKKVAAHMGSHFFLYITSTLTWPYLPSMASV